MSAETSQKLDHTLRAYGRLERRHGELKRERNRQREALERIARLEDEYREAGLPYDLDTGAQMASRRAGDIAREGLGLPARESAYDPAAGKE